MHQIKSAIQALRRYLGRDRAAIDLLDKVARIANDLRKQASTAAESQAEALRITDATKEQHCHLSVKAERLELALQKERALRESRDREVVTLAFELESLQNQLDALTPEIPIPSAKHHNTDEPTNQRDAPDLVRDYRPYLAMVNSLRRTMPQSPIPMRMVNNATAVKQFRAYEITDIIKDFSGAECIKLGQFVATLAMCKLPCVVRAEMTFGGLGKKEEMPHELDETIRKWLSNDIIAILRATKRDKFPYTGHPIPGYRKINPRRNPYRLT